MANPAQKQKISQEPPNEIKKPEEPKVRPLTTSEVLTEKDRRDTSTPGEGVLSSELNDRDAATG